MKINSIFGDITNEIINYVYLQTRKKKNRHKIKYIIKMLTNIIFENITPYLYVILSVLILMFLMNLFNFYYYVKLFIKSNPNINVNALN